MNDDIPWAGDLQQRRNSGIVAPRQRCNFCDHTVLVGFGEEEDFVAPRFSNGIAQKLCGRGGNEFVKIGWHCAGTLGEYTTCGRTLNFAGSAGVSPATAASGRRR